MKKGKSYTFKQLEDFLKKSDRGKSLIVESASFGDKAMMHIFGGNFCGDWLSGDGVLFYEDGEVHSANPDDGFLLLDIIDLRKKDA